MTILIIATNFEQNLSLQDVITSLTAAWQKVDSNATIIGISTLDIANDESNLSKDIDLILVASPNLSQFQTITQLAQTQDIPTIGLTTELPNESLTNFDAIFPVPPNAIEKTLPFVAQQISKLYQLFTQKTELNAPTLSQSTSKIILLNANLVMDSTEDFKPLAEQIIAQNALLILYGHYSKNDYEAFFEKVEISFAFISENGGGFYIPKNQCPYPLKNVEQDEQYFYQTLGASANLIHGIVDKLAKITQVALSEPSEGTQYSVSYTLQNPSANLSFFNTLLQQQGLDCIQTNDRIWVGKSQLLFAVQQFIETIQKAFPPITTYAIGITEADKSILEIVDEPYLIKQADGWTPIQLHNLNMINKEGVTGVKVALEEILKEKQH